jgi:hypothetical protein
MPYGIVYDFTVVPPDRTTIIALAALRVNIRRDVHAIVGDNAETKSSSSVLSRSISRRLSLGPS